ncbi:MAG TPA: mechanosensitive ion channel protein [Actinobacteria bacterium]|nr:mechanosensitive ion channel protein [Actinomycetota bacterium]
MWKIFFTAAVFTAGKIAVIAENKIVNKTCSVVRRFDETLVPVINTITSYSIYAVCTVIVLDIFGVNTASIIALLGAAGIAVALALKDTLANIASGIMLLILRPFRKNDFIEFASMAGTVKEIGLFTTVMETPDGVYISAPNTSIWGVPIRNYTRNGKRRIDIVIGISYSDSIETAFNVMQKIIDNEKRFLPDPPPQIMVSSIADSSINIQLRAWTTVDDFWNVRWEQNKNVKERLEEAGLTIPFPQQDVHLITEKAAKQI